MAVPAILKVCELLIRLLLVMIGWKKSGMRAAFTMDIVIKQRAECASYIFRCARNRKERDCITIMLLSQVQGSLEVLPSSFP